MKTKSLLKFLFLLLLIGGTFYIARQRSTDTADSQIPYLHNEGFMFGTVYHLTYQCADDQHEAIERVLNQVDCEFSMFNEQSTVSAINRGENPPRSDIFNEVYNLALSVNADTDGAFDITVAPLVNAWGFGFKHQQMPTAEKVDSLLKIRSQMDFSAIAKGYGCDIAARKLDELGVTNYMIEVGGEVVAKGTNAKGKPWRIGISTPEEDSLQQNNELQAVVALSKGAIATSGNYRRFYYKGGRKYAHIIDPRTGYPVQHEVLSATVLADRCVLADAYATSFMVLGLEKSKQVLSRHPELQAFFIYTDAQGELTVWHTPRFPISND